MARGSVVPVPAPDVWGARKLGGTARDGERHETGVLCHTRQVPAALGASLTLVVPPCSLGDPDVWDKQKKVGCSYNNKLF